MKCIAISAALTAIASVALYECRWFTFLIWTNAALIDHSYPLLTVGAIEVGLVAGIFAGFYGLCRK